MKIIYILIFCLIVSGCTTTQNIIQPTKISPTKPTTRTKEDGSKRFALCLPLSGPHKKIGEPMLDAAQMALFDFNDPKAQMLIINSESNISDIQNIKQNQIKIIIGPVFAKKTESLASQLGDTSIPIISFSNNQQLISQNIFLFGSAPEQNLTKITNYALASGIEEFYILAPNNEYGSAAIASIRNLTLNKDAEIVKAEVYSNDQEIMPAARKIFAHLQEDPAIRHRGLILVETGERIAKIIHALDSAGLSATNVKLISIAQIEDPHLLALPLLNGAWCISNHNPARNTFEQNFIKKYGYKPTHMAMLAYDATLLGLNYINEPRGKIALFDPDGFAGSGGVFRFNNQGVVEREVNIVEIKDGKLKLLKKGL